MATGGSVSNPTSCSPTLQPYSRDGSSQSLSGVILFEALVPET